MLIDCGKYHKISIHAPTKGATVHLVLMLSFSIFQSTLPRRERLISSSSFTFSPGISIHAPTKGATQADAEVAISYNDFNPRSHEGSDITKTKAICVYVISIHAPTKGATTTKANVMCLDIISIHAPTKGATEASELIRLGFVISIHAPTKGATEM